MTRNYAGFSLCTAATAHNRKSMQSNGNLMALSSYAEGLTQVAKTRYIEKLLLIDSVDPFLLSTSSGSALAAPAKLPLVEASDIVSYLVLQTSFLQFKARKSLLEAYNQFVSGWVKDVRAWSLNGKIVVTGRVS